jgi:hypothetical protein
VSHGFVPLAQTARAELARKDAAVAALREELRAAQARAG